MGMLTRAGRHGWPLSPRTRLLVGIIGFASLDQLSKALAQQHLTLGSPYPLWPNVFQLTLAHNTGAAFSLFNQHPGWLAGLSGLLILIILTYAWRYGMQRSGAEHLGFAFIVGGALGNLLDRVRLGYVIDFFDAVIIRYPIFNLADSFIFIGVLLVLWGQWRRPAPNSPPDEVV